MSQVRTQETIPIEMQLEQEIAAVFSVRIKLHCVIQDSLKLILEAPVVAGHAFCKRWIYRLEHRLEARIFLLRVRMKNIGQRL
jgi:hypothetical protein